MKKLGFIGGVGPESTIPYYKGIVYGVQQRVGKPFFPPLTIESLSSFEVIRMSSNGLYKELTAYLLKGIQNLVAAGAEVAALACNTGHIVFDELQAQSPIPLISIVEATLDETKRLELTKIALLGTKATMNETFFKQPFLDSGIEVVVPNVKEQAYIIDRIDHELELGIVNQDTIGRFMSIINRLVEEDCVQAIVLGCTELPLLFKNINMPVIVLDTMEIHIQKLINVILAE